MPTTQISDSEAVLAVLSLINSDLIPQRPTVDSDAYEALTRADQVRASLSTGERALVDIAHTIWRPTGTLGGLWEIDRDNAKQVLGILRARLVGTDA